jgi:hypothetical protein
MVSICVADVTEAGARLLAANTDFLPDNEPVKKF